jgi:glycosyltransferase involved in cell wall biosynthesis
MYGVSLVICCYNSAAIIDQTLSYLQRQSYTLVPWEVVLVNNASTDQTSVIARKQWEQNPLVNLTIVNEDEPGLSFARQKGIETAKYDIISFVDDDNFVPENWITEIAETFKNEEIGVLGVQAVGKFDNEPPNWYHDHKLSFATGLLYDKKGDITELGLGAVYGAGMSIRKKIYEELKAKKWRSFLTDRVGDKQTGGGDTEICYAARLLGYKIYYDPELIIEHYLVNNRITLDRLYKMTEGFGTADVFLLPYEVGAREQSGKPNAFDGLRQSVFFNYFSKKFRLLKLYFDHRNGKIGDLDYNVLKIRLTAFCDTLLANKTSFIECFGNVEKIYKIK